MNVAAECHWNREPIMMGDNYEEAFENYISDVDEDADADADEGELSPIKI
jgi:hypothetical protein